MKELKTIKQCLHRIDNERDRVALEKAIEELEELMKPKTCETCKNYSVQQNLSACPIAEYCSMGIKNHYEPKDKG
jgi:superfamily I DNA/RNA helicase